MLLAQPVKFWRQLGGSFGRRAQRIEWYGQMTEAANGINKLSRGSDIAKKSGIDLSRGRRLPRCSWWRRPTQTFGESKELAPRLVDRRRIAPIGFVSLAYVPVVEDARYRVRAHA